MTIHPDAEDRISALRQALHRMKGVNEIAPMITDIRVRSRLREEFASGIAGVEKFDLSQDAHFARLLVAIRVNLNRSESYEADLGRLAFMLDAAINGLPDSPAPAAEAMPETRGEAATPIVREEGRGQGGKGVDQKGAPAQAFEKNGLDLFRNEAPMSLHFLPSLLGPPPEIGCPAQDLVSWLHGEAPRPRGLAISLVGAQGEPFLTDLEIELQSDPISFLSSRGIKTRQDAGIFRGYGDWLSDLAAREGMDLGKEQADAVLQACEGIIRQYLPMHPGQIAALGGKLLIGQELQCCLAMAIELERVFLEDIDPEAEPCTPQVPIGSIHPDRRLAPGVILEHAFACHLLASWPMDAALTVSLLEIRQAQALRLGGGFESSLLVDDFDSRFFADCRQSLDRYIIEPEASLEI